MLLKPGFSLEEFSLAIEIHHKSYCPLCYAKGEGKRWLSKNGVHCDCEIKVKNKSHYEFSSLENCMATFLALTE